MSGTKRHFRADERTTMPALMRLMKKIGAENVSLKRDIMGTSKAAEITFDRSFREYNYQRKGYDGEVKRYHVLMDTYDHPDDNLRALYLSLEYQYKLLELYAPKQTVTQMKAGFDKVFGEWEMGQPVDVSRILTAGARWWEIMGTSEKPSKDELQHAYHALSRLHHPDKGGDETMMKRVNLAYAEGLRAIGAGKVG
jgi:hypothetical protein